MIMENPFYIHPGGDYGPGLSGLAQTVQQVGQRKKEEDAIQRAKEKFETMKREASMAYQSGDPDVMLEFSLANPEFAQAMKLAMEHKSKQTEENFRDSLFDVYQNPTEENISDVVRSRQELLRSQGVPPESSVETDTFIERFRQDPEAAKKDIEAQLIYRYPKRMKAYRESIGEDTKIDEASKVGAREILEDGTIIQSTPKGPVVWSPTGERLKGKAAAEQIKIARAEKVSNLRKAAGEKKRASLEAEEELKGKVEAGVISAKEAAKISVKAFDRLEKINKNISNLREGVRLLEEGAGTGAVTGLLPSARASSVKLDNLQGRLGLDILHSTTFGALSAAELKFALSTALPKRLDEKELKGWLEEKATAQEKLADYIEAAAIYLGTPGNTVSGWMKKQRDKRDQTYKEGQTATGPNGEKIIFRDGTWESI